MIFYALSSIEFEKKKYMNRHEKAKTVGFLF